MRRCSYNVHCCRCYLKRRCGGAKLGDSAACRGQTRHVGVSSLIDGAGSKGVEAGRPGCANGSMAVQGCREVQPRSRMPGHRATTTRRPAVRLHAPQGTEPHFRFPGGKGEGILPQTLQHATQGSYHPDNTDPQKHQPETGQSC